MLRTATQLWTPQLWTPELVDNAKKLALQWHQGQQYATTLPYEVHLQAVVDIAAQYLSGPDLYLALALGWLHDIREDTDVELEHFLIQFGTSAGWILWNLVYLLSDPRFCLDSAQQWTLSPSRKLRKQCVAFKLTHAPRWAWVGQHVKLADRLANLLFSKQLKTPQYRMYLKEMPSFLACFQQVRHIPACARLLVQFQQNS